MMDGDVDVWTDGLTGPARGGSFPGSRDCLDLASAIASNNMDVRIESRHKFKSIGHNIAKKIMLL